MTNAQSLYLDMQKSDHFSGLWQGAAYQDKLLQSYRSFHLTTQSVFTSVGAVIAVMIISMDDLAKIIFAYVVLLAITCIAFYLLMRMKKLIVARAGDVDHFHNRIIAYEQTLPREEQVLTAFKVYQKQVRQQREADFELFWKGYQLSADDRERLIEKGKGHTRAFLDKHLFSAFYIVWFSLHIIIICEVVITLFRK